MAGSNSLRSAGYKRCALQIPDGEYVSRTEKESYPDPCRSTFMPDSTSNSCANSGYMRALAVASACRTGRSFNAAIHQHPAGGVRSFSTGFSSFDYKNRRSLLAELQRKREADDAAANNNYVPILHFCIVKDSIGRLPCRCTLCSSRPAAPRSLLSLLLA